MFNVKNYLNIKLNNDKKKIEDIKMTFGSAGCVTIRTNKLENLLVGKETDDTIYDIIKENVLSELSPIEDFRAPLEYRKQLIKVFATRGVKQVINESKGI